MQTHFTETQLADPATARARMAGASDGLTDNRQISPDRP